MFLLLHLFIFYITTPATPHAHFPQTTGYTNGVSLPPIEIILSALTFYPAENISSHIACSATPPSNCAATKKKEIEIKPNTKLI